MATSSVSSSKSSQNRAVFGKGKVHIQDKDGIPYTVGKLLGKGGFAKCYEAFNNNNGVLYACKIVDKSLLTKSQHKEKMTSEITIHRSLNHPNVLKFVSYFEDINNVYVMLELCPNRSFLELHKRRRVLTDPESRFYFRQVVAGVAYLHKNNIIHRDLKLGNLLLDVNLHVKIADFGLATVLSFDGEKKKTLCGTPNYIAPEILAKCGHSFEVDVWSAGCILYTFYVGVPPFETNRLEETYERIKKNVYSIPTRVPKVAQELIIVMLHKNAKKRPSMLDVLKHNYFTTGYIPTSLPLSSLSVAPRFDDLTGGNHNAANNDQLHRPITTAGNGHPSSVPVANRAVTNRIRESEPVTIPGFKHSNMIQMKWFPPEPHGVINPDDSNNPSDTHIVQVRDNEVVTVDMQNAGPDAAALDLKEPVDCYLNEALKIMKALIMANPHNFVKIQMDESEDPASTPLYWITKWVDYSDKYGLGYALSDNSVGVLFNDTTHMQKIPCEERLGIYIEQNGQEHQFNFDKNANQNLAKKIHIFENYIKYMDANLVTTGLEIIMNRDANITRLPYLRLWIRNDDVIVFHLTCGILQANFFKDHTKIFLCPKMNAVTYIDENRVFKTYQIDKLKEFGCIEAIIERISYVRMVVKKVLKTIHQLSQ